MKTIKEYLESIQVCEFEKSISDKLGNYSESAKCSKPAKLFIYNLCINDNCLLYLCEKHFSSMFFDDSSQGYSYNKFNKRLNTNVYIHFNSHTNTEFNVLTLEEFKKANLLE